MKSQGVLMLLKDSLGSVPFNIVLAALLGIILQNNDVPTPLVLIWFSGIVLMSGMRWYFSKSAIRQQYYETNSTTVLNVFILLTCITGLVWGFAYILFLPYVDVTRESIIILVLGGMSAGAIASLSVYPPAYYAYVLPMFFPIIAYNLYTLELDRVLLSMMYILFVIMIFLTARINYRLFQSNFQLVKEKDILINELTLINLKLQKSMSEVKELSITDSLTGVYNRRYFNMVFENELKRSKRDNSLVHLVLIDIDNFKFINDNFGHPLGDEFLIYVANTLKNSLRRPSDTVYRLGGDEFALIMTNMKADDVLNFCTTLQERFAVNNIYKNVTLSMSLISTNACQTLDGNSLICLADQDLYQAKKQGKNKIVSRIIP
ncbi:MAG: GGDEF domain-containing protein [Legionella sp.]|jgi:diguanylate cyclase (GGDEF)-like protein